MAKRQEVKYELKDLLSVGLLFVVVGIGIAYGADITTSVRTDLGPEGCKVRTDGYTIYNSTGQTCANGSSTSVDVPVNTAAWNSTTDSLTSLGKLSSKLPTLATIVVAAIILGVLVNLMVKRFF